MCAAGGSKLMMVCGEPFSVMRNSAGCRSLTGLPLASVTVTSRMTIWEVTWSVAGWSASGVEGVCAERRSDRRRDKASILRMMSMLTRLAWMGCGGWRYTVTSMVFVLDNYDSFTYNLVQYMGELGAEMVVRRNDELTPAEVEALNPERILISPGPCTPEDAGISIELIRHFARLGENGGKRVPILGVCLGHQAIGAAFGGNVVRAAKLMHGKTSEVEHDGKTIFEGIPSAMTCTRYHSLIVAEDGLPERA